MKLRLPWSLRSVLALCACIPLSPGLSMTGFAQTLRLSSARPSTTEIAVIEISLDSPPGKGPTALQWETTVEGAGVTFMQEASRPDAPPTGKSIRCAPKTTTPGTQTSVCMLVGGVDPIPNGKVARLQLSRPAEKGASSVRVRVDNAIGVYTDLRRISLKPVELVVPIDR